MDRSTLRFARPPHESGILDLRMQRAEKGKPNDSMAIIMTTPVRELPLPDSMKHMRLHVLEPPPSTNWPSPR